MIRIGIMGYGNLARGVEAAVRRNEDMELVAVFTRRDPAGIIIKDKKAAVLKADEVYGYKDKIDVLVLCGGSKDDLMDQTPLYAKDFNVVDSFDTHANIPQHFKNVNEAAADGGNLALISAGWDPGLFSINRIYAESVLPGGETYTFWGKGLSQGHSDAIRRIEGVLDARQYTIPNEEAMDQVRAGLNPKLATGDKHTRECFVVAEEGADLERIENEIKTMPNYFDEYETTVNFISMEELKENHGSMAHGGFVIRSAKTGWNDENNAVIEYSLNLGSNPEFTGSVLTAAARAVYRMNKEGMTGAITMADIPPAKLNPRTREEMLEKMI